jgi:hypothetical protein
MNIGEEIAELRTKVRGLKSELEQTNKKLRELEASCPHQNTRPGVIVMKTLDEDIIHPCVKCLDCGIVNFVPSSKKRRQPKAVI